MREKKDIGTLFENKLKSGKRTPNQNLWDKIDLSLDKEILRRKRNIYYWVLGAGILISVGILALLLTSNSSFDILTSQQKNESHILESGTTSEEKNNQTSFQEQSSKQFSANSLKDSLGLKENDETSSNIKGTQEILKKIEFEDSKEMQESTTQKGNVSRSDTKATKKESIEESFNVTTKYYYYNGADGKLIETTDKNEIDSLISRKQTYFDSIPKNKMDSLGQ